MMLKNFEDDNMVEEELALGKLMISFMHIG